MDLLSLTAFIQSTLEKLFSAVVKITLEKLFFVILTFLQIHKHTSSFVFVCNCTKNKIQLQIRSKHIYSNIFIRTYLFFPFLIMITAQLLAGFRPFNLNNSDRSDLNNYNLAITVLHILFYKNQ